MPRIAGVDIPADKPIVISLTYIFGIGRTLSGKVLKELNMDESVRAKDLHEDQLSTLGAYIEKNHVVEGALRRQTNQNISLLRSIGSYRGLRHRMGLPVRGQRTSTNARTRKGRKRTVAGKKGVEKG
ncbi:MAG: 30S ribosomal protein S13 [Candidatus Brocadiales bacterium]|nr:30S ribosomal protein S13 [Candidatus Bathyanammoxibius sp.]MCQ4574939.1 30S ribosomal protein S13 [Candidatus Bathyanammoxibius amoris]